MSIQYTANQLQRKFPGPPGSPGFARLADTLRAEGRWDEAIQLCQEGLRLRPFQLSGYLVLGKSLTESGRLDEAREQYEGALRLDPRCLSAMHGLANIASQLNWADAAAGYYRSILAVEPWDRQVREMLGNEPVGSRSAADATAYAPIPAAPPAPGLAGSPESETFAKPSGLEGDVMEVNLNEIADYLPADDIEAGAEDLSLADALSDLPPDSAPTRSSVSHTADVPLEPTPSDILKAEPLDESSSEAGSPAPISGQDVEDRLDSLFGDDDAGLPASASATWTAAPAAPDSRMLPGGSDDATETNYIPIGDPGDATTIQTKAISLSPDVSDSAFPTYGKDEIIGTEFASPGPGDRVEGTDIEDRLDALFHLTDGDVAAPPADDSPADEFGALTHAIEADTHEGMAETMAVPAEADLPEPQLVEEEGLHDTDVVITLGNASNPGNEPVVTGADVADKLDDMFGVEKPKSFQRGPVYGEQSHESIATAAPAAPAVVPAPAAPAATSFAEPPPPPPFGDVMSTESMLPLGWLSDAGPQITGADIEDQLDKIFQMENGKEFDAAAQSNLDVTLSPGVGEIPDDYSPGDEADKTMIMPAMRDPESSDADARNGQGSDPKARATGVPLEPGLQESVSEWLTQHNDAADLDEAAIRFDESNPIIVQEDVASGFAGASEETSSAILPEESFGMLAPEDATSFPQTESMEMVDGADVAERLDELFASQETEPTGSETLGMEILPDAGLATEENLVSGAEVAARLDDMFGVEGSGSRSGTEERPMESGIPASMGVESTQSATQEELSPAGEPPILDAFSAGIIEPLRLDDEVLDPPSQADQRPQPSVDQAPLKPSPVLPPMLDEEDAFPADEEMPQRDGAGANVATVTLAEIYFQQGLREQALQIYRQLLEREPGNDSVRTRIQEIEASKPDGENRGPDSDPRRPRPGLKVPKRKK